MKKYIITILIAFLITVVVSVLFFTKPGTELISKLPYSKDLYATANLTVNSPNSVSVVTINDEDRGTTPVELTDIPAGEHKIVISRETTQEEDFYADQTFNIDIQPNTEAIVNVEIGPDNNLSGHILFYTSSPVKENIGLITISGNPPDALVEIDGKLFDELPISTQEISVGNHTVVIEKDGYESIEFPIVITEGYNLNVTSYLLPIPINIDEENGG